MEATRIFVYVRLDRPCAIVIEVVVVHNDEADSLLDPKIFTNENAMGNKVFYRSRHRIHLQPVSYAR